DEMHFQEQDQIVLVENVLSTLQQLANYHRRKLNLKVLAIGGSNGKTTTKELIYRVLETSFKTFSTKGNFNNHIGVPLTLLSIAKGTEIAVIEMGANHLGETAMLCEIAEPDYGIITNNGRDHLEGYGSIEGVRKGNGELYHFLRRKNGTAFVCADQPDLMEMSDGMKRITYGKSENANCTGKIIRHFPFLNLQLRHANCELPTQLIGQYNFDNIMAAVAIGEFFKVSPENIQHAIASYVPSNNRSQLLQQGYNTFILDAYNANPSSMQAALESFSMMPADNKVAILGDMLELGIVSKHEHEQVIAYVQKEKFSKVIFVGEEFGKAMKEATTTAIHFKNVQELKKWFDQQHFSDHIFLLKGSRLIGLEKLVVG
ncbi:MAG: UDP-N-acetylmuramoyl-tripeptide--D-alanyl-D-alanine ligase, partial [Chitinophagales bacterium]